MDKKNKVITSLADIQFNTEYDCEVVFLKILSEGEKSSKRPINVSCQFTNSNNKFKISSWDYGLLDIIKSAVDEQTICEVTIYCTQYGEGMSVKLKALTVTDNHIEKVEEQEENKEQQSEEVKTIIMNFLNNIQDEDYANILRCALSDERFFKWPAAKTIHHAFAGGLALHSLNVCNNAINMANTYTTPINYDLLITGALLHDVGKCDEYLENGNFSQEGKMLSHIVLGIEKIDSICDSLLINKNDTKIIKLKHIIASHHGKMEFGSPNTPVLPEAYIVSFADNVDAKLEAVNENYQLTNDGELSMTIKGLDGRILKI